MLQLYNRCHSIVICNTRYTSSKTQTRFKKKNLFMIYERFRRYSHLPHQVANNGIDCYDTKLSKYTNNIRHLATRAREHFSGNSAIFNIYLPATHVMILPLRIFIFCHMVEMILIIK